MSEPDRWDWGDEADEEDEEAGDDQGRPSGAPLS